MCQINKAFWIAISGITVCITITLSLYAYYFYCGHLQLEADLQGQQVFPHQTPPTAETPPPISGDPPQDAKNSIQSVPDRGAAQVQPTDVHDPSEGVPSELPTEKPGEVKVIDQPPETKGQEATATQPVPAGQDAKPTPIPKKASLLQHLLDEYAANRGNVPKEVKILQKLEDLCARYENGRNLFTLTNALESVLLPGLDSEVVDIRRGACNVISAAAQNNAPVQAKAIQGGVLPYLIRLLKFDAVIRPRALKALTCLLRNYPDAQKQFIKNGGISQVVLIGYLPETKVRSLHFLTDLLNERKLCKQYSGQVDSTRKKYPWEDNVETQSDDPCDREDLLKKALEEAEWWKLLCHSVRYLSGDTSEEMMVIDAVHASIDFCAQHLGHLSSTFLDLFRTKYGKDPDFKDTQNKLIRILWALKDPADEEPSSGSILQTAPILVLVISFFHIFKSF